MALSPFTLHEMFRGRVEPVLLTRRYKIGLFALALTMIMLPLVCAGALAVLACLFQKLAPQLGWYAALYCTGVVLFFVRIRMNSARRARRADRLVLAPTDEPLLFAYVEEVCRRLGAPMPRRIHIDCQMNASADFRRGLLSFPGNDLVLTIGLPLVAGLSLRQFTGVLGHELGHFSQRSGMRLTFIVRNIARCFNVLSREPLTFHGGVDRSVPLLLRLPCTPSLLANVLVWPVSRLMWLLGLVSNAASSFMLRQMEFDADRYEIRLVGSATFASTTRRLRLLNYAARQTYEDLREIWSDGRLVDNFPRYLVSRLNLLSGIEINAIRRGFESNVAGLFDAHPGDCERIESALREDSAGIFCGAGPATSLFRDFDGLARAVSLTFYREFVAEDIRAPSLVSVHELVGRQRAIRDGQSALLRYFQDLWHPARLVTLSAAPHLETLSLSELSGLIRRLRLKLIRHRLAYRALLDRYDDCRRAKSRTDRAAALLAIQLRLRPFDSGLNRSSAAAMASATREADARLASVADGLKEFDSDMHHRLAAAGIVIRRAAAEPADATGSIPAPDFEGLRATLEGLNASFAHCAALQRNCALHATLLHYVPGNEDNRKLSALLQRLKDESKTGMELLHRNLSDLVYPFEHAAGLLSVADFLLPVLPAAHDRDAVMQAAAMLVESFQRLYHRALGRLLLLAERAERLLGFAPLPLPREDEPG